MTTTITKSKAGVYEVGAGYNWEEESLGTTTAPSGWTNSQGIGQVNLKLLNHAYVLQGVTVVSAFQIYQEVGTQEFGVIQAYIFLPNDPGAISTQYINVYTTGGATEVIEFYGYVASGASTGKFSYHGGDLVTGLATNAWYHVSTCWERTAGGYDPFGDGALAQNKCRFYINGTKYGDYNLSNNNDPARVTLVAGNTNADTYTHWSAIDAIAYSWDGTYSLGDNQTLETDESVANTDVAFFEIEHQDGDYPRATAIIKETVDVFSGCEFIVKDSYRYNGTTTTSTIIFEGSAEREANRYPPTYRIVNKSREMTTIKPVGAYSGTRNAILKSIISADCQYMSATTTNMSTGGSSVVQFYGDKSLQEIANDFSRQDGFLWGVSPVGAFHYGTFALSSDAASLSANCGKIKSLNVIPSRIEYNRIRVLGGFPSSGVQVSSTVQDSTSIDLIGEHPFLEVDATLTTTAACSERALAILDKNQFYPKTITYRFRDTTIGFIPPIQSITQGFDTNQFDLVPEESYVVRGNKYDVKNSINFLKTDSGIGYEEKTERQMIAENTTLIQQVNNNVVSNQDTIEAWLAIGSANARWISCSIEAGNTNAYYGFTSLMFNVGANNPQVAWSVNLPATLGSKKLYVSGVRIGVSAADAVDDYVDRVRLYRWTAYNSSSTDLDDSTNRQSAGEYDYTFTAVDYSSYKKLIVLINMLGGTIYEMQIAYVQIRYYYDD